MRNIDLYGAAKVNKELKNREAFIVRIASAGEKSARSMVWDLFVADHLTLDDSNAQTANLANLKYAEAVERLPKYGMVMDIDSQTFVRYFFDELYVINKKVTHKGVQLVFYVFVALGLFGLYQLFF